jgi:molybdenum cofactor synthesis domain-containing protein
MRIRAAVLIVSDRIAEGLKEDRSGQEAVAALRPFADVVETDTVSDSYTDIRDRLLDWCQRDIDVVFTIGGTGLSPRDVTPEATRSVIEREATGLSTGLLLNGMIGTPRAMLSRAVAGVRGRTLVVNLPGSPAAVRGSIDYLKKVLPHAAEVLRGRGQEEHERG